MKKTLFRLFAIAAFAFAAAGCTQIDTGQVGVESVMGQVKKQPLPSGVYFTAFKTVTEVCGKEIPVPLTNLKPQTSDKITLADLDVDVYVQIDPTRAPDIMTKWTGDAVPYHVEHGSNCTAVGLNYVSRMARGVVFDVVSKFGSATIHTARSDIERDVVKELQATLDHDAKGMFSVHSANVKNLVTDPALEQSIKQAAQAQFQIQNEQRQLEVAKIQAERKRVAAQGEADAIRIKAQAVSAQGGPEYVQLQAVEKWDGKLPNVSGGGALPFIQVK